MANRALDCELNKDQQIYKPVSPVRHLRAIFAAIWLLIIGVAPVTGFSADEPHEAILAAVQALRNNDIRALVLGSVGDEEFNKLATEWTEKRDSRLAEISDTDRAAFAAQMGLFTADGAEDAIMAILSPQLAVWKEQAAQFVPMIQGLGELKIEQLEGATDEGSQRLNQVLQALAEWAQNVDIASPELARQAIGVATRMARDLDVATLDDLAILEFDEVLERVGTILGGVRETLSIYGLSLDETLDSYDAETIANDGATATVKNTFTILGAPMEVEAEYVLVDEKWLSRDAIEQSQKMALLADAMAAAESTDSGAPGVNEGTIQAELLPAEEAYLEYRAVLESAENYDEIAPYWSTAVTGMEVLQSPEVRRQELEVLKNYASNVQVIGYSAFTSEATLYTEGADADENPVKGQVYLVDDGDGWKIEAIEWQVVAAVETSEPGPGMELYEAVLYADTPMVKDLLDKGGDPNYRENNRGLLAWAAQSGSVEIVEALIAAGADLDAVDSLGQTALMRAIELQLDPVAEVLISAGSDLEIRDANGQTVAVNAAEQGQPAMVKALVEAGADFNIIDINGNSLVLVVVQSYSDNMLEIVALLGESGADLDHSNYGYTALYYAVEQGDEDLTRALLEAGANPDTRTDNDGVPLIASISYPNIMRVLLAAGADPNQANKYGENSLYRAIDSGSIEDVQALIDAGANVNLTEENGQTPLKRADSFNKSEMVELLTKHGATLSGQAESDEVQPASTASTTLVSSDEADVVEESEATMQAEPVLAETEADVVEDTSVTMVAALDPAPMVENDPEVLQSALDQNPFLKRYQLGLTVVELEEGFAIMELTSASDALIQQARRGVDLLSVGRISSRFGSGQTGGHSAEKNPELSDSKKQPGSRPVAGAANKRRGTGRNC